MPRQLLLPPSPVALELFRISLGGLVGLDLLQRFADVRAHYGGAGVRPFTASFLETLVSPGRIDLFLLSDSLGYHQALFVAGLLAASFVCLGVKTRLATLALWLILLSVQNRNSSLNEGADVYVRVMLFWSLFLPMGRYLTVPTALARVWPRAAPDAATTSRVAPLALYAYSIQIGLVYLCSVLAKLATPYWPEGRGLELALQVDVVRGLGADWLLAHSSMLPVLTYLTLLIQAAAGVVLLLPTGLFVRSRLVVLAGLTGMHVGIAAALSVGLFAYYAAASLLPLVPSRAAWPHDAGERERISSWTWPERLQAGAIVAALAYVILHLLTINQLAGPLAARIDARLLRASRFTGLHQRWIMFSGVEYNPYGRVVGRHPDGTSETIFAIEKKTREAWDDEMPPPYRFATNFSGYRWKKLFVRAWSQPDDDLYRGIGAFLCAETARLSPGARFESIELTFLHEKLVDGFARKALADCHRAQVSCASCAVHRADCR